MDVTIEHLETRAYKIPTDAPESDGTLQWNSTMLVVVFARAAGTQGLGYTYSHASTAHLIHDKLRPVVEGSDALAVQSSWEAMRHTTRNLGRPGIVSAAMSSVDVALWDLKARLLDLSLVDLLGPVRSGVPIYGSGGFTSYTHQQLRDQLGGWANEGIGGVKMKVGRDAKADPERVRVARQAIGDEVQLMVDANGAFDRKQALRKAEQFAEQDVVWFEEPVSSDDLDGLRLIRDRAPAGMQITAGEYGYQLSYFRRMLEAGAVDVLMADCTRCSGFTGFLGVSALCRARSMPLSGHTAPNLHAHVGCACGPLIHTEYFHDHVRIENMLFDGALRPDEGELRPDRARPGMGLALKEQNAKRFLIWKSAS